MGPGTRTPGEEGVRLMEKGMVAWGEGRGQWTR